MATNRALMQAWERALLEGRRYPGGMAYSDRERPANDAKPGASIFAEYIAPLLAVTTNTDNLDDMEGFYQAAASPSLRPTDDIEPPQLAKTLSFMVPGGGDVVGAMDDAPHVAQAWQGAVREPSAGSIGSALGQSALAGLSAFTAVPALLGTIAEKGGKRTIRAYHGSPHDFDKFDLSKIGTGEGAQAYGHGLYFAENEGVAKSYRDTMSGRAALMESRLSPKAEFAASFIQNGQSDMQILEMMIKKYDGIGFDEAMGAIEEAKKAGIRPGRMYEVNINADPEDFLDWDKPLSEQPERVRKAYAQAAAGDDTLLRELLDGSPESLRVAGLLSRSRGSQAYNTLSERGLDASGSLLREGIPGIKYLDQGSRAAGEGSRNYVVFDDKLIEILRKYGLSGLLAGTGAASLIPILESGQNDGGS